MVSNAQLDNEKNQLMYQVDTLKDSLMEMEELLSESRREHEDKVKVETQSLVLNEDIFNICAFNLTVCVCACTDCSSTVVHRSVRERDTPTVSCSFSSVK